MKLAPLFSAAVCLSLLAFCAGSTGAQTVVTFDDLSETGSGSWFSIKYQGYEGLTWSNILCNNAILYTNVLALEIPGLPGGRSGDYCGMASASNVVMLISGCEIDSPSTNFDFLSAYLTGAWNNNQNIEVHGFNGAKEIYDTIVVASATNPTLFTFNYLNIDRLYFTSSGGQPAFGYSAPQSISIMDNFEFEFVPEPSSLLLTALGAVPLVAFLRRKRR